MNPIDQVAADSNAVQLTIAQCIREFENRYKGITVQGIDLRRVRFSNGESEISAQMDVRITTPGYR